MSQLIAERMAEQRPKRMLALDGGGTRGIISLGFLAEIEALLAKRFAAQGYYGGDASRFRLAHYYDMIGGTSGGSMIAAQLAWGERVEDIERRFKHSAPKIFRRKLGGQVGNWLFGELGDRANRLLGTLFDARTVRGVVWGVVGNATLGSDDLKTGLTIIAKRVDTGSVWALNNNPGGRYYHINKVYPLPDLIRASTAAPTYFSPASIGIFGAKVGDVRGTFVDGGISPHNNPALKLLLMAGIRGYNLGGARKDDSDYPKCWRLGSRNLLITSVGTGSHAHKVASVNNGADAASVLLGMAGDGQELGMTILQWLSSPRRPWEVDRMYGDLSGDMIGEVYGSPDGVLSFHRYDIKLEDKWLEANLGYRTTPAELKRLQDFTRVASIEALHELAREAAKQQVDATDFPDDFDGHLWDGAKRVEKMRTAPAGTADTTDAEARPAV